MADPDNEIRIKLAPDIHKKWQNAAAVRGLTVKGFIASTVSAELIRTGELDLTMPSAKPVTAVKPAPVERDWSNWSPPKTAAQLEEEEELAYLRELEQTAKQPDAAAKAVIDAWRDDDE